MSSNQLEQRDATKLKTDINVPGCSVKGETDGCSAGDAAGDAELAPGDRLITSTLVTPVGVGG